MWKSELVPIFKISVNVSKTDLISRKSIFKQVKLKEELTND